MMACDLCGRSLFQDNVENVLKGNGDINDPRPSLFVCELCRKDAARRFSRLYAAGALRTYWRIPMLHRMMDEWEQRPHIITPGAMGSEYSRIILG